MLGGKGRNQQRKSIRLKEFDYSSGNWYYVTICTHNFRFVFGEVIKSRMTLNSYGNIAEENWNYLTQQFTNVELDEFVVMPNHIHGIIIINSRRGLIDQTPIPNDWIMMKDKSVTLGKIVRFFKARTTKHLRDSGFTSFRWQRNYYEHIIRNEEDLYRIRKYIQLNPLQWAVEKDKSVQN